MHWRQKKPTVVGIENITNIGSKIYKGNSCVDNYENTYVTSYCIYKTGAFHALLNANYSRFIGTAYVKLGATENSPATFYIEVDGVIVYRSPQITKTSRPIELDIDIVGCNEFKLHVINGASVPGDNYIYPAIFFGNCGFIPME